MNTEQKNAIIESLKAFVNQMGSQNKAANAIGISSAILTFAFKGDFEKISDEMWRRISAGLTISPNENWKVVKTRQFNRLSAIFTDAQQHSLVYGVIGDAGCGKTTTIKHYTANNSNVLRVSCSEFMNRKAFLNELLRSAGLNTNGATIVEMVEEITTALRKREKPLIILDEADKLSDQVLHFFIAIYNALEDQCGIVLVATDYLEKRIKRGVKLNKKGYKEIFSRIGKKFVPLDIVNSEDIAVICSANGIEDLKQINAINDDSDSDLRRVKRKIHAIKISA